MIYISSLNLELIVTFMLCQHYGYITTTRDSHIDQMVSDMLYRKYMHN